MLKKIAAVAAVAAMTALPVIPAQAATLTAFPDKCGWHMHGSESFYYGNCTSTTKAVHYGDGINPDYDQCVTAPAYSEIYVSDRAVLHFVANGACK